MSLYSIALSGSSEYLQLAAPVGGSYQITVAGWIKTTSAASTSAQPVNSANPLFGWDNSGSALGFGVNAGVARYHWYEAGDHTVDGAIPVDDGTWHHIAATHDCTSGAITIYVDGAVDTTGSGTVGSPTGLQVDLLGAGYGGDYFDGRISDLYLYQRVLDASEITSLYEFTDPDSTSILGEYLLTEGTGSTAADTSGNANTATLTGGAAWVADNPQSSAPTSFPAALLMGM